MDSYNRPRWARRFPESHGKSLLLTACGSALVGLLLVLVVLHVAAEYGIVLFIAVPCTLGFLAPTLHGMGAPRTLGQCIQAALLCQCALFAGIAFIGVEGIFCIAMASPLWISNALIGGLIAYPIHRVLWRDHRYMRGFPVAGLTLICLLPLLAGAEHVGRSGPDVIELTSTVEIDAPPALVWQWLVSFPEMPRPQAWPFRCGVAYPVRADLQGRGLDATRFCVFSTGAAPERVTTWDEPRTLAFEVLSTPPPMVEWSPWRGIEPAHLQGYLQSRAARFEFVALPGNRTRLIGTSWYTNQMYPAFYWRWWSDAIIREVHHAVFAHVKTLAEEDARRSASESAAGRDRRSAER
jgi:hypothetical protein